MKSSKRDSYSELTEGKLKEVVEELFNGLPKDPPKGPYGCLCKSMQQRILGDGCYICNPLFLFESEE